MREKELRIALVCFGGISLAVYMHGISKEVLKLVRASAALHDIDDREARARAHFFDAVDSQDPEYDTEAIYFDLLRDIGRKLELRIVVDVIAGASAGGINGAMLARAICHDLRFNVLRDLWLENADVTVLLAQEAKASTWSKAFMQPLIWLAAKYGIVEADKEVTKKLSLFVRSRWFKPPLDGGVMDALMYDAATAMKPAKGKTSSLLPIGHAFDLFVTLTDYHGYYEQVAIHDPPVIHEIEHRQLLHFGYRRRLDGLIESDLDVDDAPGLAFAARATSSFPGAFPPSRIADMDALVASRGAKWPKRDAFIAHNFRHHRMAGVDPATASFIDGSVLNDRPFHEAIAAIHGRFAFRQVDRRLVYIDPTPRAMHGTVKDELPKFFSTLWGAASDIPRAQPFAEELRFVAEFNERMRQAAIIVTRTRPRVSALVTETIPAPLDRPVGEDEVREWREQVNMHVTRAAGFASEGYVRLKLASARMFITRLIVQVCDVPERSPLAHAIGAVIEVWATRRGFDYNPTAWDGPLPEEAKSLPIARFAEFLLDFDVKYRERRLNFLIEGQNRLYELVDTDAYRGLEPGVIDLLKGAFYVKLEDIRNRQSKPNIGPATQKLARTIFAESPSIADIKDLDAYANEFVDAHDEAIEGLLRELAAALDLDGATRDLDRLIADLDPDEWHHEARRYVLVNYLGFPFWDVLTFPMMVGRESGELNQILIDRISPEDVRSLKDFAGLASVKGSRFGRFAAFLSRAYRENDYLLGRLHALDRLIDIVCDSAGRACEGIDIIALKKRGFLQILAAEEPHLAESGDLIRALRAQIAEMG
ncbi:MAG: patatin-like protein [Xanthobacteraceae bacterium]|nr:patatin-like protein [Xanthobacteraceae bacterium]